MVKTLARRLSFATILVICALLGILLGTGIAYASLVMHNLFVGTYTYTSTHDVSHWMGFEWYYQAKQRITMSADKTDVTFVTGAVNYSTSYLNGDANEEDVCFGPLWIWDSKAYHSVYYDNFIGYPIDMEGYSYYSPTYWFYGNMDTTNNLIFSEQVIWFGDPWGGYSSLGADYNAYKTQGSW